MDRFIDNLVIAAALSVLEAWGRASKATEGSCITSHPALFHAVCEVPAILALQSEALREQEMFSYPHGRVWEPIDGFIAEA